MKNGMGNQHFELHDERDLRIVVNALTPYLTAGQVFALVGDLGAGKTTLVQSIAHAMQVTTPDEVRSPSYALMHEYPTSTLPLVHIDLYRLDDPETLEGLGLIEALNRPDAVVVVEWADRFPDIFPSGAFRINIDFPKDAKTANQRLVTVTKQ